MNTKLTWEALELEMKEYFEKKFEELRIVKLNSGC